MELMREEVRSKRAEGRWKKEEVGIVLCYAVPIGLGSQYFGTREDLLRMR